MNCLWKMIRSICSESWRISTGSTVDFSLLSSSLSARSVVSVLGDSVSFFRPLDRGATAATLFLAMFILYPDGRHWLLSWMAALDFFITLAE